MSENDVTNFVIIAFAFIVLIAVLSACCKVFRRAQLGRASNENRRQRELTRARRLRNGRNPNRAVRVRAVQRGANNMAFEVYEIHVTRRPPPSAATVAATPSSAVAFPIPLSSQRPPRVTRPRRQHRRRERSDGAGRLLSEPPPPAFSAALDLPSPSKEVQHYVIDMEEPPPSYEDYLKTAQEAANSSSEPVNEPERY